MEIQASFINAHKKKTPSLPEILVGTLQQQTIAVEDFFPKPDDAGELREPRLDHGDIDRLENISVGARFHGFLHVLEIVVSGYHQCAQAGVIVFQSPHDLDAGYAIEMYVGKDDLYLLTFRDGERFVGVGSEEWRIVSQPGPLNMLGKTESLRILVLDYHYGICH